MAESSWFWPPKNVQEEDSFPAQSKPKSTQYEDKWAVEIFRNILKNYPLTPDKYYRHAQYDKMLLLLRSLNQRALGTRIKKNQLFESVLVRQKYFIATLSAVFILKLRRCFKKSQKRWINNSSMQSRNVHDFLTEIVLFKQKQLDDISVRRIKILFTG